MLKIFNRRTIGDRAESIAQEYLQKQGLRFVDKNFHCRQGEIDLIFKDKDTLVFIEVRYRKNSQYGHSFETVTQKKQQKILTAARHYLHKHKLTESVSSRFDVIGIDDNNNSHSNEKINWIKNAFSYY
ncbi:MAG: YraN family protein [Arenicella sp.]